MPVTWWKCKSQVILRIIVKLGQWNAIFLLRTLLHKTNSNKADNPLYLLFFCSCFLNVEFRICRMDTPKIQGPPREYVLSCLHSQRQTFSSSTPSATLALIFLSFPTPWSCSLLRQPSQLPPTPAGGLQAGISCLPPARVCIWTVCIWTSTEHRAGIETVLLLMHLWIFHQQNYMTALTIKRFCHLI